MSKISACWASWSTTSSNFRNTIIFSDEQKLNKSRSFLDIQSYYQSIYISFQSLRHAKIKRLSFLDTYTMGMDVVGQIRVVLHLSTHLLRYDMEGRIFVCYVYFSLVSRRFEMYFSRFIVKAIALSLKLYRITNWRESPSFKHRM